MPLLLSSLFINVTVAASPDTEETIVCCAVGRRRLQRFGAAVVLFAVVVGDPVAMVEGSVVGRLAVALSCWGFQT